MGVTCGVFQPAHTGGQADPAPHIPVQDQASMHPCGTDVVCWGPECVRHGLFAGLLFLVNPRNWIFRDAHSPLKSSRNTGKPWLLFWQKLPCGV